MATPDARKHTLDILDNLRLYCPAPSCLNDPFECHAPISFDAPVDIKNERAKRQLMAENPSLSETEAARLAPDKWREVERDGGNEFRRWLREDTGMICFSTCKDDILMWSHYAGSHNGICIELRLARESHVNFCANVHEVGYENQVPTVPFYAPTSLEKVKAFVLTKAKQWSYEQECRMVVPDAKGKSRLIDLPPGIISGIYLGCQISPENKAEVLDRLATRPPLKDIDIYQARCAPNAFGLVFDPIRISKARRRIVVSRRKRIDMDRTIEGTTDKWFQETVSKLNDNVHPGTAENDLLFGVVPVAYSYCKAVFLLARDNHKLPAMAVRRVLAELTLRIMWCLYEDNPKRETPGTRIMRWRRTTCDEELKYLKQVLPLVDSEEAVRMRQEIARVQSDIAKNPHRPVGPLYNSLDELPPQIKNDLYPLEYSRFNRAIHPNLKLFEDLVKQTGSERIFLRDPEKPSAGMLRVAAMTDAFHLLSIVHFNYRWDCEQMKAEYLTIKKNLANQS